MDNDMLSSLLSDPEALQNAVQAVSGMLGGGEQPSPPPANGRWTCPAPICWSKSKGRAFEARPF